MNKRNGFVIKLLLAKERIKSMNRKVRNYDFYSQPFQKSYYEAREEYYQPKRNSWKTLINPEVTERYEIIRMSSHENSRSYDQDEEIMTPAFQQYFNRNGDRVQERRSSESYFSDNNNSQFFTPNSKADELMSIKSHSNLPSTARKSKYQHEENVESKAFHEDITYHSLPFSKEENIENQDYKYALIEQECKYLRQKFIEHLRHKHKEQFERDSI